MFTKTKIFNVTLSTLLLAKEVDNADTDNSNEVKILNRFYPIALEATLQDLDLDSLSAPITLELIEELENNTWNYVYKFPNNCALLRRLASGFDVDNKSTFIPKRTGIHNAQKVIFTNQYQAVADTIPEDVPLEAFSASAGLALAYNLAFLSAPLLVGKGAKALKRDIKADYVIAKMEAQEVDATENFTYEDPSQRSEFVEARLS